MSVTEWTYAILLLYPEARRETVEAWYASEFPGAGELLTPIGKKAGEDWYAAHFVAKKEHATKWLEVFAATVGGTVPDGFVDLPRETQRTLMQQFSTAASQAIGISFTACFNDEGERIDHNAAVESLGIVRAEQLSADP
jgi:hypothetical protein